MKPRRLELPMNRHVDFAHARETYVIYPWVRDGEELVRPLRFGSKDAQIAVARIRQTGPDRLEADVHLDGRTPEGLMQVREALVRCLQLDYPYDEIESLAAKDAVTVASGAESCTPTCSRRCVAWSARSGPASPGSMA